MDTRTAQQCWETMLDAIKLDVTKVQFENYYKKLSVHYADNLYLAFYTSDRLVANTVSTRHMTLFENKTPQFFGMTFRQIYILDDNSIGSFTRMLDVQSLNPAYTFDTYIMGTCNQMAFSAAMAVAEQPGTPDYNPLFLYGGAGLGKTHLMTAIANYVASHNPTARIKFYSSEKFTNEFVEALRNKKTSELRSSMRSCDLLFVDDIQFLTGRDATQEEFFNAFNDLYEHGKQIVISSDRTPDEISGIEARMRSRFKHGLVQGIDKPDFETRVAILKSKADNQSIICEDEALELIAQKIDSNIRELEGAFNQALFLAKVRDEYLTSKIAQEALKSLENKRANDPRPRRTATVSEIVEQVAHRYGIRPEDILSKKRNKEVMLPRHLSVLLTEKILGYSQSRIGTEFNRDHTTIINSLAKAKELLASDSDFKSIYDEVLEELS